MNKFHKTYLKTRSQIATVTASDDKVKNGVPKIRKYQNGLTEVGATYSGLLQPMAQYVLTNLIRRHPPIIATDGSMSSKVGLNDVQVDVGKTKPVMNNLLAFYKNKIVKAFVDYRGFRVFCYTPKRDQAKAWIDDLNRRMRTENQYIGKCLYSEDGGLQIKEIPAVSWDDIVLSAQTKKDIKMNTLNFLNNKKLMNAGVNKRGLVLHGPPGTGKTSIIKALFNEMEGKRVSRLYVTAESFKYASISSVFDILDYLGSTLFAFEDIDAMGTTRDRIASNSMLNDLLTNMDGMRKNHNQLVTMATTNRLEMLDEALANRPCRFDRRIEVGLPSDKHLKSMYFKLIGHNVDDSIIKLSQKFTGAHVYETVNTAKILSVNEEKNVVDCLEEACKIVRSNFFPATSQPVTGSFNSKVNPIMKISEKLIKSGVSHTFKGNKIIIK